MRDQREQNTKPELLLRRELHRRGLRFRLHRRPIAELRRTADLVFPSARVAVFIHGCFWHRCPTHGTLPKNNAELWAQKLDRNVARDTDTVRQLRKEGWRVVTVWEHENVQNAASRVERIVRRRAAHP